MMLRPSLLGVDSVNQQKRENTGIPARAKAEPDNYAISVGLFTKNGTVFLWRRDFDSIAVLAKTVARKCAKVQRTRIQGRS
jgi:hypothetical protein